MAITSQDHFATVLSPNPVSAGAGRSWKSMWLIPERETVVACTRLASLRKGCIADLF